MKRSHSADGDFCGNHEAGDAPSQPSRLAQFRFEGDSDSRFKSPAKRPHVIAQTDCESSLAPLLPVNGAPDPQFLILGSAPSVESLSQQRYYAHRFNHFWPVIARVFDTGCSVDAFVNMEYSDRVRQLCGAGVIVWDMCKTFVRPGSSDSKLTCHEVNDIDGILRTYPSIKIVGLNGQAAFNLFKKHVVKAGKLPQTVPFVCLPSTSPLNAMKNAVDIKAAKWRKCFGLEAERPAEAQ